MAEIAEKFAGLPMGLLIAQPILEVAKGQAELCNVYLDQLFKLAFSEMPEGDKPGVARTIKFKLSRPVLDKDSGTVTTQDMEVEAPLLSLVPVPAFTMQEATVKFTMEVKESEGEKITSGSEAGFQASYGAWGFKASVSGKVTASKENTRQSDQSAKYEIYARAAQQEPAEGMAKLSSIFASVIEPVST